MVSPRFEGGHVHDTGDDDDDEEDEEEDGDDDDDGKNIINCEVGR